MGKQHVATPQIRVLLLLLVILFTVVVYWGSLGFGFVNWDDDENIRQNPRFTEFSAENITYHYQHHRYKALAIWTYMAEYQVFGGDAGPYHRNNLILHLLNVLLVFVFIKRLLPNRPYVALITASLFALHPAFVEPVAWVTGRKDLLFVLFALLSMMAYIGLQAANGFIRKHAWFILVAVLMYLAGLAKIQAVALPFILLILDVLVFKKFSYHTVFMLLILLAMQFDFWSVSVILAIFWALAYTQKTWLLVVFGKHYPKIVLIMLAFVLLTLVFPFSFLPFTLLQDVIWDWVFIRTATFVLFIIVSIWKYKKLNIKLNSLTKRSKIILVSTIVFLFTINYYGPAIILFANSLLGYILHFWTQNSDSETYFSFIERFALLGSSMLFYLKRFLLLKGVDPMIPYPEREADGSLPGSMWIDLLIVIALTAIALFVLIRYFRHKPLVWFGLLFFLINISLVMHLLPIEGRILVGDRYTYLSFVGLFLLIALAADYFIEKKKAVIVIAVLVAMLAAMAANTWRDKALWQNSFTLWQKALEVNRENHYAMFSLALAHMAEGGDAGEAVKFLTMAIERKPDYLYYNNRGRVHYANQNYPDALADFEMAIALDSSSYASYNNRGAVLQQYCNFSNALADYEKAVEIQTDYQEAINNKQKILTLMHFDSIVMLQSMPPGTDTTRLSAFIVSMSDKMLNTNQRARAIDYLNRGILLVASDASLYQALALAYHRNHEFSKANMVYNKGLNALPENPILLLGRGLLYIQTGDTLSACSDFKSAAMQGDNDSQQMLDMFCR